jgi:hypothetical protein
MAEFAGEYPLDVKRSQDLRDDINVLKTVKLVIRADKSIGWGAGKWHELKLVTDLNEKGVATYMESFQIGGKTYETKYTVQLHADGYIEINGHFFKVNRRPNKPDAGVGK